MEAARDKAVAELELKTAELGEAIRAKEVAAAATAKAEGKNAKLSEELHEVVKARDAAIDKHQSHQSEISGMKKALVNHEQLKLAVAQHEAKHEQLHAHVASITTKHRTSMVAAHQAHERTIEMALTDVIGEAAKAAELASTEHAEECRVHRAALEAEQAAALQAKSQNVEHEHATTQLRAKLVASHRIQQQISHENKKLQVGAPPPPPRKPRLCFVDPLLDPCEAYCYSWYTLT